MTGDDFSPTLIVGMGRGGAIMGAMISGALGHRPLIVIDRKYEWKNGRRIDGMIQRIEIDPGLLKRVLLIDGEVHTGNTMRLYYDYFRKIGAEDIRRATLYYQKGVATEPVEYKGFVSSRELRMPWMFTKRYRQERRSEKDAKGMQDKE
jgi:probable phosphoglycerate mutase